MNIEAQNPGNISKSSTADLDCFSYGDELIIQDIGKKVGSLLDDTNIDIIKSNHNKLELLLNQLKIEVTKIRDGYCFGYEPLIYEYRLLRAEEIFDVLLDRILKGNRELRSIIKNILSLYNNELTKDMIDKSIISEYLSDIVFEAMTINDIGGVEIISFNSIGEAFVKVSNLSSRLSRTIAFGSDSLSVFNNKPNEYLEFIKHIGKTGITELSLNHLHFVFGEDLDGLLNFFKVASTSGIYKFNITLDVATAHFVKGTNILPLIISSADSSGILSLDFHGENIIFNALFGNYSTLDSQSFADIFNAVGKSNLKHFGFGGDYITNSFINNPTQFSRIILTACGNKLKSLNLSENNLFEVFGNDYKSFINLVHFLGKNGIKFLNISLTNFGKILGGNLNAFFDLIRIAGESGVRAINLSEDDYLPLIFNEPELIVEYIRLAGNSGIKCLLIHNAMPLNFLINHTDIFIRMMEVYLDSGLMYLDIKTEGAQSDYYKLSQGKQDEISQLINRLSHKRKTLVYFD